MQSYQLSGSSQVLTPAGFPDVTTLVNNSAWSYCWIDDSPVSAGNGLPLGPGGWCRWPDSTPLYGITDGHPVTLLAAVGVSGYTNPAVVASQWFQQAYIYGVPIANSLGTSLWSGTVPTSNFSIIVPVLTVAAVYINSTVSISAELQDANSTVLESKSITEAQYLVTQGGTFLHLFRTSGPSSGTLNVTEIGMSANST